MRNVIFSIFFLNFSKQYIRIGNQAFKTILLHEINFSAMTKQGRDQPGIDLHGCGEISCHFGIILKMF